MSKSGQQRTGAKGFSSGNHHSFQWFGRFSERLFVSFHSLIAKLVGRVNKQWIKTVKQQKR